jgi:predicted SAM-dependent methyltransferase
MLEHLDYPDAALAFLREVRRVLRPGGVLRLVVPDIHEYLAAYARRDRAFFQARRKTWPDSERCDTMLIETLLYAGAASQPHDFFGHKFGYDVETLKLLLRKAGFRRVERSAYMKSRHPELRVDSASPYARAAYRGRHYSLFVDAVR